MHNLDFPNPRLSERFFVVPTSSDNRGWTVHCPQSSNRMLTCHIFYQNNSPFIDYYSTCINMGTCNKCAYLLQSAWCSSLQAMADEDLVTDLSGSEQDVASYPGIPIWRRGEEERLVHTVVRMHLISEKSQK